MSPAADRLNGAKVKELREKAGFKSQSALARALGVQPSTVQRWESGDTAAPEMPAMMRLARTLRTTVDYLLDREAPSLPPRKRQLIDEVRAVFGRAAADAIAHMDRLTDHHRAIVSGRIQGWCERLEEEEREHPGRPDLPPTRFDIEEAEARLGDEEPTRPPTRNQPAEPAGGEAV